MSKVAILQMYTELIHYFLNKYLLLLIYLFNEHLLGKFFIPNTHIRNTKLIISHAPCSE